MLEPSLAVELNKILLESGIYNAAGARCTTREDLEWLGESYAGAILTKSCTLEYRHGNPSPRYYETPSYSINSNGLHNWGHQYYAEAAKFFVNNYNKPYFISVAGLTPENNIKILQSLNNYTDISAVELNLSCPNVVEKSQIGYNFEECEHFLNQVGTFPNAKHDEHVDLTCYGIEDNLINGFGIEIG